MDKICLDTDFLIYFLRKQMEAESFIAENEANTLFATTYVNLFELYKGAYNSRDKEANVASIENLKEKMIILNMSEDSMKLAAISSNELKKKGELIEIRDLFIGTIALANQFKIKTNNKKHFSKIPKLEVI